MSKSREVMGSKTKAQSHLVLWPAIHKGSNVVYYLYACESVSFTQPQNF